MEGTDNGVDLSISAGAAAAAVGYSRWNPTKEQIDLLEGLYKQGIRTPNAEQIQQITHRLRAFGHIEGKNVFYWFQNHKARQRQKQKQDSISYLNRYLHKNTVFPPYSNVCSPFCIPYASHHQQQHQQPKVLLPRPSIKRKQLPEKMAVSAAAATNSCSGSFQEYTNRGDHQTLNLFPLQPSGNLQSRSSALSSAAFLGDSSNETKCISDQQGGSSGGDGSEGGGGHLFFDFFCENGPCESH